MTTIAEKIIQTREKINSGPENVVFARLDALHAVQLALDALSSNGIANSLTTATAGSGQTLVELCEQQAGLLAFCQGYEDTDIVSFGTFSNSTLYDDTDIDFTFPTSNSTVTRFCISVVSPDGENVINLTDNTASTQTIVNDDGTTNTFSTYYDNYYFVQSRATGSLVRTTDVSDLNAVLLPNVEKPLGSNTVFGIAGEANTWNEHYATMDISSFALNVNTGMRIVETIRPLANGLSNTFNVPKLYDPLVIKRKITDGDNEPHTPAFVGIVVCEGLLINTSWLPVGDNAGDYSSAEASTTKAVYSLLDKSFETRLDYFHNTNLAGNTNPIFKTLANTLNSTSQEIPQFSDLYPNKDALPLKPFVTNKEELQPTGLGERDLFCGRYIHIEKGRLDSSGNPDQNYRFLNDTAAKYFYMIDPLKTLHANGTVTAQTLPSFADTQHTASTDMSACIDTLTGFTRDTTNFPLTTAKNLFTTNSADPHVVAAAANAYGTMTLPTSGSNSVVTGGGVSNRSLYIKNDGQITDATGAEQTIASSSTTGTIATHYYYVCDTIDDTNELKYQKLKVDYIFSHTITNSSHATSTLSRSVDNQGTVKAPFLYNDVNDWRTSDKGYTVNGRLENLYNSRNNKDAHFEAEYDGVTSNTTHVINATAQSNYEDFYDKISTINSTYNTWLTNHVAYGKQVANTSATTNAKDNSLNYNTSIYPTDFGAYQTAVDNFESRRLERISTLKARIGQSGVVYSNTAIAPQDSSGSLYAYQVTTIPTVTTSVSNGLTEKVGVTPYGRRIFDMVNMMVDFDTGFLRDAFDKINAIQFAFEQIKQDRNVYEVLNRRSKQF